MFLHFSILIIMGTLVLLVRTFPKKMVPAICFFESFFIRPHCVLVYANEDVYEGLSCAVRYFFLLVTVPVLDSSIYALHIMCFFFVGSIKCCIHFPL